jgi:hypothetical protein
LNFSINSQNHPEFRLQGTIIMRKLFSLEIRLKFKLNEFKKKHTKKPRQYISGFSIVDVCRSLFLCPNLTYHIKVTQKLFKITWGNLRSCGFLDIEYIFILKSKVICQQIEKKIIWIYIYPNQTLIV